MSNDKKTNFPILATLLSQADTLLTEKDNDKKLEPSKGQPETPNEKSEAHSAEFEKKQVFILIASKHKDRYDQREAKILKILSSKLRVELLQGPSRGEEKDILKTNVKLKAKTPEKATTPANKDEKGQSEKVTNNNDNLAEEPFGKLDD